ncbi:MAG: CHASE4 domain-containing protein [Pseudomonadota bacterium]|nr:CHASE4 domain-containing protein [Pseudomonadota bacterium]
MTLRKKIYLVVILTFLALTTVLALSSYRILINGFEEVEREDVRSDLRGALSMLEGKLACMDASARDYSSWDDMYDFVVSRKPSFVVSNFSPSAFINLRINFLIVTDLRGNIVYSRGFDLETGQHAPTFKGILARRHLILGSVFSGGGVRPLSGVLWLPERLTLVSAWPILKTSGKGAPRGLYIIGRYLDARETALLGAPLKSELSFYHEEQGNLPEDVAAARQALSPERRELVRAINDDAVSGYALFRDAFGKDSLIVKIQDRRTIFRQGMKTIVYVIVFVLLAALIFAAVMVALLEKSVLRRVLHISHDIRAIEANGIMGRRIDLEGADEIASLGRDINNMLGKLEESEAMIRGESERYRAVIEDQTEFICRFGADGILSFVNDAYRRFFSHRRQTMIGRHFLSFIPDDDRRLIHALLDNLTPSSSTATFDARVVFPDGQEFWQNWTYRALYDDAGLLKEYQAVGRDITDRKHVEEKLSSLNRQLEEANTQLAQAYANMKQNLDVLRKHLFKEEIAFLLDRDGRIFGITERVLEYLKVSRNQLIGASVADYLTAHDRSLFDEALHDAWIGIAGQVKLKLVRPQNESPSQEFEIKFARMTLEGKRLLLLTLR